jgi:hypothetical protein
MLCEEAPDPVSLLLFPHLGMRPGGYLWARWWWKGQVVEEGRPERSK